MVQALGSGFVDENASSIVFELFGCIQTAGNGPSLVDFVHHSVCAVDGAILVHAVDMVRLLRPAPLSRPAVAALDKIGAIQSVGPSLRLIDTAGFVCDIILVHELERRQMGTSLAPVVVLVLVARNNNLRSDIDIWERGFSGDLDSV